VTVFRRTARSAGSSTRRTLLGLLVGAAVVAALAVVLLRPEEQRERPEVAKKRPAPAPAAEELDLQLLPGPVEFEQIKSEGEGVVCWFTFKNPGNPRTVAAINVEFRDGSGELVCHNTLVFLARGFQPRWSRIMASAGTPVMVGTLAVGAEGAVRLVAVGSDARATEVVRAHITITTTDGEEFSGRGGAGLLRPEP